MGRAALDRILGEPLPGVRQDARSEDAHRIPLHARDRVLLDVRREVEHGPQKLRVNVVGYGDADVDTNRRRLAELQLHCIPTL